MTLMKPQAETHWSLNKVVSCYFERSLHISSSGGHVQFESLHQTVVTSAHWDVCNLARYKPNWTTCLRVHWPHSTVYVAFHNRGAAVISKGFHFVTAPLTLTERLYFAIPLINNHNQGKVTKTSCRANGPSSQFAWSSWSLKELRLNQFMILLHGYWLWQALWYFPRVHLYSHSTVLMTSLHNNNVNTVTVKMICYNSSFNPTWWPVMK